MNAVEYTVQLLYNAVNKAATSPNVPKIGDLITITRADNDVIGIVKDVMSNKKGSVGIILKTASGQQLINVSENNFIHIIQKAEMLNLRKHMDYERDYFKDMLKEKHQQDGRPEHSPVEKSDKSELPTSKVSLSLRRKKTNK